MNESLMTDVDENYQYIRTIVDNKIEIAKIDLSIATAKVIGYILLSYFMLGMLGLFLVSLIIALAIFLGQVLGSLAGGVLLAGLVLPLLAIFAFAFFCRAALIFKPVSGIFYNIIKDKELDGRDFERKESSARE